MDDLDFKEIARLMRRACEARRGYADHFGWSIDRDIEEWGVVTSLLESLQLDEEAFFHDVFRRGRGSDPPDCEARLDGGGRIALEVTELVDPAAIKAYKAGQSYVWADWDEGRLIEGVKARLAAKDIRHRLKDGPYERYVVVIHTDEPLVGYDFAKSVLEHRPLGEYSGIDEAYLLISYDPGLQRDPYIKLRV